MTTGIAEAVMVKVAEKSIEIGLKYALEKSKTKIKHHRLAFLLSSSINLKQMVELEGVHEELRAIFRRYKPRLERSEGHDLMVMSFEGNEFNLLYSLYYDEDFYEDELNERLEDFELPCFSSPFLRRPTTYMCTMSYRRPTMNGA